MKITHHSETQLVLDHRPLGTAVFVFVVSLIVSLGFLAMAANGVALAYGFFAVSLVTMATNLTAFARRTQLGFDRTSGRLTIDEASFWHRKTAQYALHEVDGLDLRKGPQWGTARLVLGVHRGGLSRARPLSRYILLPRRKADRLADQVNTWLAATRPPQRDDAAILSGLSGARR
jgi:hypothetical protein